MMTQTRDIVIMESEVIALTSQPQLAQLTHRIRLAVEMLWIQAKVKPRQRQEFKYFKSNPFRLLFNLVPFGVM